MNHHHHREKSFLHRHHHPILHDDFVVIPMPWQSASQRRVVKESIFKVNGLSGLKILYRWCSRPKMNSNQIQYGEIGFYVRRLIRHERTYWSNRMMGPNVYCSVWCRHRCIGTMHKTTSSSHDRRGEGCHQANNARRGFGRCKEQGQCAGDSG